MRDAIRFTVAFGAALLTDGIIERFGFGGWVLFAAAVLAYIAVDKLFIKEDGKNGRKEIER